jgi:hypothetical protein
VNKKSAYETYVPAWKLKSVIQDAIKNDVIALKNDTDDHIEKSTSTVSVGQEDFENIGSLNQALKL